MQACIVLNDSSSKRAGNVVASDIIVAGTKTPLTPGNEMSQ